MTTPDTIVTLAKTLWEDGYRGDKHARPINKHKPLIPAAIAEAADLPIAVAVRVNHLLAVWSMGTIQFGEYDEV